MDTGPTTTANELFFVGCARDWLTTLLTVLWDIEAPLVHQKLFRGHGVVEKMRDVLVLWNGVLVTATWTAVPHKVRLVIELAISIHVDY